MTLLKKIEMEKSHLKISNALETQTKLQYCLEEATMFLLKDYAACPTQRVECSPHSPYLQCNFKL